MEHFMKLNSAAETEDVSNDDIIWGAESYWLGFILCQTVEKGVNGKILQVVQNMHKNDKSCVKICK